MHLCIQLNLIARCWLRITCFRILKASEYTKQWTGPETLCFGEINAFSFFLVFHVWFMNYALKVYDSKHKPDWRLKYHYEYLLKAKTRPCPKNHFIISCKTVSSALLILYCFHVVPWKMLGPFSSFTLGYGINMLIASLSISWQGGGGVSSWLGKNNRNAGILRLMLQSLGHTFFFFLTQPIRSGWCVGR